MVIKQKTNLFDIDFLKLTNPYKKKLNFYFVSYCIPSLVIAYVSFISPFGFRIFAYFFTENYQGLSFTRIGILEISISLFLLAGLKDNTRINLT